MNINVQYNASNKNLLRRNFNRQKFSMKKSWFTVNCDYEHIWYDVATQYTAQTFVLWWVVINFSFFSLFYFFCYHLCLLSPFFFFLLFFHLFCLGHFGMLFPFNFMFLGCCICLLLEFLSPFLMQQYKTSPNY